MKGSPFDLADPTGHDFSINGGVVGSVEVINKGAVWIVPTIGEKLQSPLGIASAALLLYQDISRN